MSLNVTQLGNAVGVQLFVLVCAAASLDGCAALKNYPDRSNDVDADLRTLQQYFDPVLSQILILGAKSENLLSAIQ